MISPSKLLALLDKVAASYRTADATSRSAVLGGLQPLVIGGDGSPGNTVYGTGDGAFIVKITGVVDALVAASQPDVQNATLYSPFVSQINSYLAQSGGTSYANLDQYATVKNTASRWSFLVSPNLAYLQFLYNSKKILMAAGNVFAPLTTFGSANITGAGAVAFTDSAAILLANNTTTNVQGYVAAPGLVANVSAAINGTLTVTVTASGQSAAGAAVSGRTWTAVLDNAAVGASIAFTPSISGDRIADVTAVAVSGSATAGQFSLQSVLERVVN